MDAAERLADLRRRRDKLKAEQARKRAELKDVQARKRGLLDQRIRAAKRKADAKKRREDTRRKVLAGAWVLSRAAQSSAAAGKLRRGLDAYLDRDRDRALFDLPPRERS